MIKAIFFDAGGTLFAPFPSVGELYAHTSMKYGTVCDPAILEDEFIAAWKRRGGLASLGTETSEEKERAWWRSLVEEVFSSHGGVKNFDDFFEHLYHSFERRESWAIFPEVSQVLEELRSMGYVLGVVSNWDLRLPRVVRNLGLGHHFDFLLGSSECGATKPHPKIFKEALKQSKTRPEETVHVGDSYEEDYVGAEGVGIRPYLLDRHGQHTKSGHIPVHRKIKCLREFRERIGRV